MVTEISTKTDNACRNAYDCLICKTMTKITSANNIQLIETNRDFIFFRFGRVKKVSIKSELFILLINMMIFLIRKKNGFISKHYENPRNESRFWI